MTFLLSYREEGWSRQSLNQGFRDEQTRISSKLLTKTVPANTCFAPGCQAVLHLRYSDGRSHPRLTKGKVPTVAPYLLGTPGVTLFTIGAKSGKERSTPLLAVPYGEQVILVASNWGKKLHPAWYHNLKQTPETELLYDGQRHPYTALLVEDGPDYEQLWRAASQMYFGYDRYKERTGGRKIPLFLLTPSSA